MEKQNNLLFFVADQMRADALAHLGSPGAVTPNFDGLAADGVSYRFAYSQNPVCVPSRISFLTGLYPHTMGHRTMHFLLRPEDPMLLKTLKQSGYQVLWVGQNGVIPMGSDFSQYCDAYYPGAHPWSRESSKVFEESFRGDADGDNFYSFFAGERADDSRDNDRDCVDHALAFLDSLPANPEKPFAIFLALMYPHPPYGCEEPWYSLIDRDALLPRRPTPTDWSKKPSMMKGIYDRQQMQCWDEDRFREMKAVYYGMVSQLDSLYGEVAAKLREKQLYDDTTILMFSDHGDYTGDYGIAEKAQNMFHDCTCHVPLIVKPAAGVPCVPRVSNALVELADIPATVADLCGFQLDYTQFGCSLRDTLAGSESHRDTVFSEGGRIHGETQAMELGHQKESIYWPRLNTQACEGPEHTKAIMARDGRYKYICRLYEADELYDMECDPQELNNLAADATYAEIIVDMRERIFRWLWKTADFVPMKKDKGY